MVNLSLLQIKQLHNFYIADEKKIGVPKNQRHHMIGPAHLYMAGLSIILVGTNLISIV